MTKKFNFKCIEPDCNVTIDEDLEWQYKSMVNTHLRGHYPEAPKNDKKERTKDHGDWASMDKYSADMYQVGSMSTADFDGFEIQLNVILDDYDEREKHSSKVKSKVLNKMEALRLRGLEEKVTDPSVKVTDLIRAMREMMVSPTNWCKAAWDASHTKQNQGESMLNFIERKEKMVKIAELPWTSDGKCSCIDDMLKYSVIRGVHSERLRTKIFDDRMLGNDSIKKTKWSEVRERLIKLDKDMDMEEDKPSTATVNKISKSTYKKNQKQSRSNTREQNKDFNCKVCKKSGHFPRFCPLRCKLDGCTNKTWHLLMPDHMEEIEKKKKNSGSWKKGASVNQVDGDESDSGSCSEASVTQIHRIQSQVAHITFVRDSNKTTAHKGDPGILPKLKIT